MCFIIEIRAVPGEMKMSTSSQIKVLEYISYFHK